MESGCTQSTHETQRMSQCTRDCMNKSKVRWQHKLSFWSQQGCNAALALTATLLSTASTTKLCEQHYRHVATHCSLPHTHTHKCKDSARQAGTEDKAQARHSTAEPRGVWHKMWRAKPKTKGQKKSGGRHSVPREGEIARLWG